MRISPIRLNQNNFKLNKINRNSDSSNISNTTQESKDFKKISFQHIKGMYNISFKGSDDYSDIDKIIKQLQTSDKSEKSALELKNIISDAIIDTVTALNSPLLEQDENGATFFHKCSYEKFKSKEHKITPYLLKIAFPMQDKNGNTFAHYEKEPEFVNAIIDILGDNALKIFKETLLIKNDKESTFLHESQHPETLKAYARGLGDNASEVFAKICVTKDEWGKTPIDKMLRNNKFEEFNAVAEILGDRTSEVIKNYFADDENQERFVTYSLEPEFAETLINIMGDDAHKILKETLSKEGWCKNTFLHYDQHPDTLKIYAKVLDDDASQIFATANSTENNWKKTPFYKDQQKAELVEAIINGEIK